MLVLIDSVGSPSIESCCLQIGIVWFLLPSLCLSLVLIAPKTILNKRCESKHSYLILYFGRNAFIFPFSMMLPISLSNIYFIILRYVHFILNAFRTFIMKIFQIIFIINWDDNVVSVFKFFICVLYLIDLYMLLLLDEAH